VLVTDIGLPGEDGHSLITKVREIDGAGGEIPAIAVTGFARSEDRTRVLAAGSQTHVPKPVDADELITTIASLTGRRRDLSNFAN
jgi:CheY-like chemotaxis protein